MVEENGWEGGMVEGASKESVPFQLLFIMMVINFILGTKNLKLSLILINS